MKAVILAAGLGKRMQKIVKTPKPLLKLFGIPLIEHTIRRILKLVDEVVVVYHYGEVAEYLKNRNVKLVYNPHPEKGNAYSLYLAGKVVDDDFVLLMSDHYYGDEFFDERLDVSDNIATLFVSERCVNPEEATKVKVDGQKIVDIGKSLKEYDYFDTGFFICKKEIFDYIDSGKKELSEIMSELSKLGKVGYHLVEGLWIDVDTPDDMEVARKYFEDIIRKGDDGYISRHINRRISIKITEMLSRFEWIKPNHLTIISFFVGILSSLLFFTGNVLLGGITAQVCSIVDGCDGELARLKSMKTKFGEVLDCVSDRYADIFIILGMLWAYGLTDFSVLSFFLASTGSILLSYTWHKTGIRVRASTRDMRLFIIMVGGILAYVIGTIVIVYTMLIIGITTHAGVLAMLFKSRM